MEWRDIPEFVGVYQIREDGLIRRLPIKYHGLAPDGRSVIKVKDKPFFPKQRLNRKGYPCVDLCLMDQGKKKHFSIHRLVAMSFLDNFKKELTVDHLDCNKLNNHYSNLECVTNYENLRRSHEYGTHSAFIPKIKKRSLTIEQVDEIRRLYFLNESGKKNVPKPYCQRKLAKIFNCSQATIKEVVNFRSCYDRQL